MKRIIRLTESDLTRLVKRVIRESKEKDIVKYGYGVNYHEQIIQAKDNKDHNSMLELYSDNTFSLIMDDYPIRRIFSNPLLVETALYDMTGDRLIQDYKDGEFVNGIKKGIYKLELGEYGKISEKEFRIKKPIMIIKTSSKNGGDGMGEIESKNGGDGIGEIESKVDEIIDRLRNLDFSNKRNIEIIEDLYRFINAKL